MMRRKYSNEYMENYYRIKSCIFEKFNQPRFASNEENVSLLDVKDAADIYIGDANSKLLNCLERDVRTLNIRNRFNKNVPTIHAIENLITSDGCETRIVFETKNGEIAGSMSIFYNENGRKQCAVNLIEPNIKYTEWVSFISKSADIFDKYESALLSFSDNFPNVPYIWSNNRINRYSQVLSDGTFEMNINLDRINSSRVSFANIDDLIIATESKLYDYIDFYNEELAAKTTVKTSELNTLLNKMVSKYLGYDKVSKLTRG